MYCHLSTFYLNNWVKEVARKLVNGIPNIGGSLPDTMVLAPGQTILAFFIGAGFFRISVLNDD